MRKRAQAGFTLLEVVVAFVLLSVTLVIIFQIFSTGLARAGSLDEYSQALVLAQSKLAASGVEEQVKEGETRGETGDHRFQWTVAVKRHEEVADPDARPQSLNSLYRVESGVRWRTADGRERSVALATLVLGPNP